MNESLIKADIFFFVATVALVLITLFVLIGTAYIISILRIIRKLTDTARAGAETVVEGIHEAKETMKEDGYVVGSLLDIFKRVAGSRERGKRKGG